MTAARASGFPLVANLRIALYLDVDGVLLRRVPVIALIKPVPWRSFKTNAIDFEREFVWVDDAPLAAEIAELAKRGRADSLIRVSTDSEPKGLLRVCAELMSRLERQASDSAVAPRGD